MGLGRKAEGGNGNDLGDEAVDVLAGELRSAVLKALMSPMRMNGGLIRVTKQILIFLHSVYSNGVT